MYGRYGNNIYILISSFVLIIIVISFTTYKVSKEKEDEFRKQKNIKRLKCISIVIILAITSLYGIKIYKSATNYGGKLAWIIQKIKNERRVEFEHNNIFEYGLEGIFEDISKKHDLPEKLYISDSFELKFDSNGTITSFDTFLYGKNAENKDESFLITYDKNKSEDITFILNGHVNADYDDNKLLEPLIKTVKAIKLIDVVEKFNENNYGLLYFGKRSFGFNTQGIVYVNGDGEEYPAEEIIEKDPQFRNRYEIIGYTVSIFVPGKEEEIIPSRYNLITRAIFNESEIIEEQEKFNREEEGTSNKNNEYYVTKKVGYRLDEVDYALGSIFYTLSKTIDGGKTWETINEDPFGSAIGDVSGITFLDEKFGFIVSSRNGGANAELYGTKNGGTTFYFIDYIPYEVNLENGASITPFDFPSIPFEENGVLNMLVGQGNDGDYNGNSKALYQSTDNGETWVFIKEVK